jgi:hypothetical protein
MLEIVIIFKHYISQFCYIKNIYIKNTTYNNKNKTFIHINNFYNYS